MAGSFTTNGTSPVVYPITLTYNPGGLQVARSYTLITGTTEPFWVTAALLSTALSNYKLNNPGGNTSSGGSVVVP